MLWILLILPMFFGAQGQTMNKCSDITVNSKNATLHLTDYRETFNSFFGNYVIYCTGVAIDNSTKAYWIRNNSDGINATFDTKVEHFPNPSNGYVWDTNLTDKPPKDKFPYTYQCVVSNYCGDTITSPKIIVNAPNLPTPSTKGCANFSFGALPKNLKFKLKQRTINVTWEYDLRKEDTGFRLAWKKQRQTSPKISVKLGRPIRQHLIPDLVPFTTYNIHLEVLYGGCHGISLLSTSVTLPDNPSLPRNLTVEVRDRGSLDVTWSQPEFPNGILLKYKLFWESDLDGKFSKSLNVSDDLSYVITNLERETNYSISIKAINNYGEGERTSASYAFIECGNEVPEIEIEPRERDVEISWEYKLGFDDTGFLLKLENVQSRQTTTIKLNRTTREHVIPNLVPFTQYKVHFEVLYYDCISHYISKMFETLETVPGLPRMVKAIVISDSAVNLTWIQPEFPNGELLKYQIYWREMDSGELNVEQTIDVPIQYFQVITGLSANTEYSFAILTVNGFGNGERTDPVYATTDPIASATSKSSINKGAVAGGVVGVIILLLLILVGLLLIRKRAKRRREKSVQSFHEIHGATQAGQFLSQPQTGHGPVPEPQSPQFVGEVNGSEVKVEQEEISYIVLLDDWEISRDNLTILEKKLGGGQFGIVKQGLISKQKEESEIVAVKMLKVGASASDRSDLLTELKILKEVNKDPHPNVLQLIGACSTTEPLLLVMEFCPGGNLRKFLLNSRVDSKDDSSTYINLSSTLTHRQLLKLSVDVANGMIHLSSLKFVHRDLAARNVLIGENDTAKLSDFGLARDIKEDEEYIISKQNLLPVKWMSLESLLHGRFTTSSDIWSFGILLYEIATLGDEPYKNISPYNIVSHVGSGCRMEKPSHCSDEVYTIMRNCWKVDPNERPSFKEIHDTLHSMLTDDEKCYINITQTLDEGPLKIPSQGNNLSIKDGCVRYTTSKA